MAIFGGTFDPIHNAHLTLARAAAERFAVARILFVPAGRPPHRLHGAIAPYEDRFQMVKLACMADARFEPSRLEEGDEPSYSIHTIERVRASGYTHALSLIIGADAFADIGTWHRWHDVVDAVTFIVVSRPGAKYEIPAGARVLPLEDLELPVSSSEIRKLLKSGSPDPPIPASVAAYIQQHGLYR